MIPHDWHVDERLWAAYAQGRLDIVAEASVDAHVTGCATCREAAGTLVAPAELALLWETVRSEVTRPRLPWTLRWLRRVGVPDDDLVLLAASDGLALPWALAVAGALACAVLTGLVPARQDVSFLLLAPLIPVLAVAAAYDAIDPLRGLAAATPYSKLRLAMMRTTATLVVALPVVLAVGMAVPGLEPLAWTWLLPSLAMTTTTLVLVTWLAPWAACGVVAATWAAVVLATAGFQHVTVLTGAAAQGAFVAVVLTMGALLVVNPTLPRRLGGGIR